MLPVCPSVSVSLSPLNFLLDRILFYKQHKITGRSKTRKYRPIRERLKGVCIMVFIVL
jgi:hypothetical protein